MDVASVTSPTDVWTTDLKHCQPPVFFEQEETIFDQNGGATASLDKNTFFFLWLFN